ncbi:hypothetical protein DVH24_023834 [Malus domestica]|uniref:Uncharacterized protein n=1 Tax=Malus domestica TaxID=3750 RepID=A0A498KQ67_MALDO|nr:hypothetical protein DVH24_023834 [Malus domestica]
MKLEAAEAKLQELQSSVAILGKEVGAARLLLRTLACSSYKTEKEDARGCRPIGKEKMQWSSTPFLFARL